MAIISSGDFIYRDSQGVAFPFYEVQVAASPGRSPDGTQHEARVCLNYYPVRKEGNGQIINAMDEDGRPVMRTVHISNAYERGAQDPIIGKCFLTILNALGAFVTEKEAAGQQWWMA